MNSYSSPWLSSSLPFPLELLPQLVSKNNKPSLVSLSYILDAIVFLSIDKEKIEGVFVQVLFSHSLLDKYWNAFVFFLFCFFSMKGVKKEREEGNRQASKLGLCPYRFTLGFREQELLPKKKSQVIPF